MNHSLGIKYATWVLSPYLSSSNKTYLLIGGLWGRITFMAVIDFDCKLCFGRPTFKQLVERLAAMVEIYA